jgi:hypothetical protein
MIQTYRVEWEIEIDAETPREAAEKAFEAMQVPTTANAFDVYDPKGNKVHVDLMMDDEEEEAKKAVPKKPARTVTKTAAPKKDRAWFETKVAELKTEAERLPSARQKALRKKLKEKPKGVR